MENIYGKSINAVRLRVFDFSDQRIADWNTVLQARSTRIGPSQPLFEPVSFADIFGCMVGETLLGKQNMKCKLSDFRSRLSDFKHPMIRG